MKLIRPALVATAAAAALVALPATAASAQTLLHLDKTHDVRSLDLNGSTNTTTREPKVAEGDVQAIGINHARHSVTVVTKYRELSKTGPMTGHEFFFRTSAGKQRVVVVLAGPGAWSGRQMMQSGTGKAVHCSGMSHTIDYAKNKVILTVPRSCLGKPRWVRVGEASFRLDDNSADPSTGSSKAYLDDAFSPYVSNNIHYSPMVHRG